MKLADAGWIAHLEGVEEGARSAYAEAVEALVCPHRQLMERRSRLLFARSFPESRKVPVPTSALPGLQRPSGEALTVPEVLSALATPMLSRRSSGPSADSNRAAR